MYTFYYQALFLVGMFLMTASTYDNLQKAMGGPAEIRPYKDKGVNIIEEDMAVLEAKKGLKDGEGNYLQNVFFLSSFFVIGFFQDI